MEINEKEIKETIVKMNKTKSLFFNKINKIDKLLARLIKKKIEKNQINKIRNEKGEVTTDNAEVQRVIRDYYKQLYDKIDNLEEMARLLEKLNLPRLNQEEIEIMNNPITSTDIKAVIKNLPKTKAQDQMASQENSIKHLEKSYAYLSKTLSKNCRGRNTSKFILRAHHHPDTKTRQRQHTKKRTMVNIDAKILNKI